MENFIKIRSRDSLPDQGIHRYICGVYIVKERLDILETFESIKFNGDLGIIKNNQVINLCFKIISNNKQLNSLLEGNSTIGAKFMDLWRTKYPGLMEQCITGNSRQFDKPGTFQKVIQDQEIADLILLLKFTLPYNKEKIDEILEALDELESLITEEMAS